MKRFLLSSLFVAGFMALPSTTSALTITQTFCLADSNPSGESATCPEGLGATLEITDGPDGTDPNDFFVTLTLDSTDASSLTGINAVQFDTEYKADQYEFTPTVDDTLVDGSGTWTAFFGDINDCDATFNNQDKSVCSVIVGGGSTDTGDVDVWKFTINLLDSITNPFPDGQDSALNLRASFLPSGNLSPNFVDIPDEGGESEGEGGGEGEGEGEGGGEGGAVPEPASLLLLGSGLAMGAARLRRQNKQ